MSGVVILCASNIAVIGASGDIAGIVIILDVIWAVTAMKAVSGVMKMMKGPTDHLRRIVKEPGSVIVTTAGAMAGVTAEEMGMTNSAALKVAGQLLFRCQTRAPGRAKVEGRIMGTAIGSLIGEAAVRQMETPFPCLRRKLHQYGRVLWPLISRLNLAPSRKGHDRLDISNFIVSNHKSVSPLVR